jgi:hypothetical protein
LAAEVRTVRTTRGGLVEHDLHPGQEFAGATQQQACQLAVLGMVREERISREHVLAQSAPRTASASADRTVTGPTMVTDDGTVAARLSALEP